MRLTAKERILLHLLDYARYSEAVEVPPEMTQEGVAEGTWINVRHLSQYAHPLVSQALIRERVAHVTGLRQRRKVYDLTDSGKMAAIRLRERVKVEVVRVHDQVGLREQTIGEVMNEFGSQLRVLQLARRSLQGGIVDITSSGAPTPSTLVEMIADAPRLETFVGREAELEVVTRDGDRPRIFVVRGVAGIGKTSFAAKACEILRQKRNLFWHRIRPWDTPQSLFASLGRFLSVLGRPGLSSIAEHGEGHRAFEVLQKDLPSTRSLLVFDDAQEGTKDVFGFFRLLKEAVASASDVRILVLSRKAVPFYDRRDVALEGLVADIDLTGLEPKDAIVLLGPSASPSSQPKLVRSLGGHPLLLKLAGAVRHSTANPARRSDVRLFLEEQVFTGLSVPEKRMMTIASLYRIPVPRASLLPEATLTYQTILDLTSEGLLVAVRGGYLVHDTVRDFFASMMTAEDKRDVEPFVIGQLQELAAGARSQGDPTTALNALSNAIQVAESPASRGPLQESLGDEYGRIGNLPAAIEAYRESIKLATEPEVLARLHRKIAGELLRRRELRSAPREIEAGFRALAETVSVERGWLETAQSFLLNRLNEYEVAKEHARAALSIFEAFDDQRGPAHALAELGLAEVRTGGNANAEGYFARALEMVDPTVDLMLMGGILTYLMDLLTWKLADLEAGRRLIERMERLVDRSRDLRLRARFCLEKGLFHLLLEANFDGAESAFTEAIAVARQVYDRGILTNSKFGIAATQFYRGRFAEAIGGLEEAAAEWMQMGGMIVANGPDVALGTAALCRLTQADIRGFRRLLAAIDDPRLAAALRAAPGLPGALRGFDMLARRDDAKAASLFEELIRGLDASPSQLFALLCYSAALRVIGLDVEADDCRHEAIKLGRSIERNALLSVMPKLEAELVAGLRRIRAA